MNIVLLFYQLISCLLFQEDQLGTSLLTNEQIRDEGKQKQVMSKVEVAAFNDFPTHNPRNMVHL